MRAYAFAMAALFAVGTARGQLTLAAPQLIHPEDNSWFEEFAPFSGTCCYTFVWGSVSGATSYGVQVFEDSLLTVLVVSVSSLTDTLLNSHVAQLPIEVNRRYFWRARAQNGAEQGPWSPSQSFVIYFPIATEPPDDVPSRLILSDVFPNPASDKATIRFVTQAPGHVDVGVVDGLGRRVSTLMHSYLPPGTHEAIWRPESTPTGMYLVRVVTSLDVETRLAVHLD